MAWRGTTDVDGRILTRTAPEGIKVLIEEESLPDSKNFEGLWECAKMMAEWPTAKGAPSTETQVQKLCAHALPVVLSPCARLCLRVTACVADSSGYVVVFRVSCAVASSALLCCVLSLCACLRVTAGSHPRPLVAGGQR